MPLVTASYSRDGNYVPITSFGLPATATLTLTGTGTVVSPLWTVTGALQILALYGEVKTAVGINHTAAFWRLNDQTAQPAITVATGTTLSGIAAGSMITKAGLAAAALVKIDNSAGRVNEPTTLETSYFSPFVVTKKTAALTQIEYVFTTTDNPTTGQIQFTAYFMPLSADAALTAVSS